MDASTYYGIAFIDEKAGVGLASLLKAAFTVGKKDCWSH